MTHTHTPPKQTDDIIKLRWSTSSSSSYELKIIEFERSRIRTDWGIRIKSRNYHGGRRKIEKQTMPATSERTHTHTHPNSYNGVAVWLDDFQRLKNTHKSLSKKRQKRLYIFALTKSHRSGQREESKREESIFVIIQFDEDVARVSVREAAVRRCAYTYNHWMAERLHILFVVAQRATWKITGIKLRREHNVDRYTDYVSTRDAWRRQQRQRRRRWGCVATTVTTATSLSFCVVCAYKNFVHSDFRLIFVFCSVDFFFFISHNFLLRGPKRQFIRFGSSTQPPTHADKVIFDWHSRQSNHF